jgi:hypothetical protein
MHRQPRLRELAVNRGLGAIGLAAVMVLSSACITIEALPTQATSPLETPGLPTTTVATPAETAPPTDLPIPTLAPTLVAETPALTPASTFAFDPTSEEALLASMLDTIDVDPLAETSGVEVGTEADDLPAFAEQGGLRRAAQTIDVGSDFTVFDFRYQFPTATAAAAFLDAEAESLGETDSGAVESEPPTQLGDDTRYYTSHLEIFVIQDSFNYLIRVENVVAKVWIGGDPEFINAADALGIATSAWGRMTVVFDPSEIDGL